MNTARTYSKWFGTLTLCFALSSCALIPSFGGKKTSPEQVYTLEPAAFEFDRVSRSCGSLALGDAIAAPGFRTSRMAYSTAPFEVDYFAYARWADSVARLLRRPLKSGFDAHSGFAQVLSAPAVAPTEFRVELTDVSLLQRFESPQSERSEVELSASMRVFSINPNRVLDTHNLRLTQEAGGDPASGVAAANALVARLVRTVVERTHAACAGST